MANTPTCGEAFRLIKLGDNLLHVAMPLSSSTPCKQLVPPTAEQLVATIASIRLVQGCAPAIDFEDSSEVGQECNVCGPCEQYVLAYLGGRCEALEDGTVKTHTIAVVEIPPGTRRPN